MQTIRSTAHLDAEPPRRPLTPAKTLCVFVASALALAACDRKSEEPKHQPDAASEGPSVPGDPVAEPETVFSAAEYRTRIMPLAARAQGPSESCHPTIDGDGVSRREWCYEGGKVSSKKSAERALPEDLSIVAWSCVEPFSYEKDAEAPSVALRYSLGLHRLALRAEGKIRVEGFPETPSLGIGLGDQIYVDPRPAQLGAGGASLAAFGGDDSAERRIREGDEEAFFRATYEAYFLNEPMARVLSALPVVMTWDDHEIRDGWGSQGDEGEPEWRAWFDHAGKSFAAWQLKRGPLGADAVWQDPSKREGPCEGYPQYIERGDVSIYVTDQRTCRTPDVILGRGQINDLKERLSEQRVACGAKRTWVIASATPLFITKSNPAPDAAATADDELKDDVLDRWSDGAHAEEQREVIGALVARMSACTDERLIVISGDIHRSGLIGLSTKRDDQEVTFGYEIISSGVAADVDGSHNTSNIGTTAYNQGEVRGDWIGLMDSTPSFAELHLATDGKVEVAWHVSNGRNPDDLVVNEEHLIPMICDKEESEPYTFTAERTRSTVTRQRGERSGSVLVDTLKFGGDRQEMDATFHGQKRGVPGTDRLETALHPSSIFSINKFGAKGNAQVRDLSSETLCTALTGPPDSTGLEIPTVPAPPMKAPPKQK